MLASFAASSLAFSSPSASVFESDGVRARLRLPSQIAAWREILGFTHDEARISRSGTPVRDTSLRAESSVDRAAREPQELAKDKAGNGLVGEHASHYAAHKHFAWRFAETLVLSQSVRQQRFATTLLQPDHTRAIR